VLTLKTIINRYIMKNPIKKDNSDLLVPIVIGAAAAAALTYFFLADSTSELREKLTDNVSKGWDAVKEKVPVSAEDISALKDKVTGVVDNFKSSGEDAAKQV
jgi:gas vesicle protein